MSEANDQARRVLEGASQPIKSLKPVPIAALKATENVQVRLYLAGADGRTAFLYRGRELEVTRQDLERLESKGIRWLYVDPSEERQLRQQLKENFTEIIQREELRPEARFQLLQFAVEEEVNHAFGQIKVQAALTESQNVASHLVSVIGSNKTAPQSLFSMMRHDWHTFTHMINVSAYCVMLAKRLGIRDRAELEEIATGGMMHDIGKRFIPPTILNKPGRLTEEEAEVIRRHPQQGFEELGGRDDVSWGQLMMVYQHHEKADGSGYPVGVTIEEIHPWGRLCAVVDVFDALTSVRPYHKAKPLPKALEFMESIAGKELDEEMVKCWAATMRENPDVSLPELAAT